MKTLYTVFKITVNAEEEDVNNNYMKLEEKMMDFEEKLKTFFKNQKHNFEDFSFKIEEEY